MFRFYQTCEKGKEGGFADGRAAETKGAVLTKSSEVFPGMFEQTPEKDANISDRITYHLHRTKTSHWKLGISDVLIYFIKRDGELKESDKDELKKSDRTISKKNHIR